MAEQQVEDSQEGPSILTSMPAKKKTAYIRMMQHRNESY